MMEVLSSVERQTLERLADEFGLKTLSDHTGLSKHTLKKAMKDEGEVSADDHAAILDYLNNHV